MAIEGLTLIAEAINDSVPSTHKLFESGDLDALLELARMQDRRGAAYIDINIGPRPPEFMAQIVEKVQGVTDLPLAIDTPDPAIAKAGLQAYDPGRAGGARPILNSITALRAEMFDLYRIRPFRPILLISEQLVAGQSRPCHTSEETCQAARTLVGMFLGRCGGATNAPIGSDTEGNIHRLIAALRQIHQDQTLAGVHASVGLSNFTVMLPAKRPDGMAVKSALESAFLTKAMPLGLDMVIGSVKRNYQLLPPDHPAVQCLDDCLKLEGFDVLMRVREFYT